MTQLVQVQTYIPYELLRLVDEVASRERLSRSEVIRAAVHTFISPDGLDRPEAAYARRLDRMDQALQRSNAALALLLEALTVFVETWLRAAPPTDPRDQRSVDERGAARFNDFLGAVGEALCGGGSEVWRLLGAASGLVEAAGPDVSGAAAAIRRGGSSAGR